MPTDAQAQAKEAIFKAVTKACEDSADYSGGTQAAMVRDAAYAWRAAVGGTQPGTAAVVVEK